MFERSSDARTVPVSFSGIVWFPFFSEAYTTELLHTNFISDSNVQLDSDYNVCISSVKYIYLYGSLIQSLEFISGNFDV